MGIVLQKMQVYVRNTKSSMVLNEVQEEAKFQVQFNLCSGETHVISRGLFATADVCWPWEMEGACGFYRKDISDERNVLIFSF